MQSVSGFHPLNLMSPLIENGFYVSEFQGQPVQYAVGSDIWKYQMGLPSPYAAKVDAFAGVMQNAAAKNGVTLPPRVPAPGGAASPTAPGAVSGSQPRRGVTFTPDPTVNGPWTHTRADIPLFKSAPAQPASAAPPTSAAPRSTAKPTIPSGLPQSFAPAAAMLRPTASAPRQPTQQTPQQLFQAFTSQQQAPRQPTMSADEILRMLSPSPIPAKRSPRDILADILSGR